jgi:hypothetical protein
MSEFVRWYLLTSTAALAVASATLTGAGQPKGDDPPFVSRLACVINADGTIARGYMIEKCELQGENEYIITWKLPLQGEVKTNFSATIGSATTEAVQPGLITVGLCKDSRQMRVKTYEPTGKPARRPFHIAAFRDK